MEYLLAIAFRRSSTEWNAYTAALRQLQLACNMFAAAAASLHSPCESKATFVELVIRSSLILHLFYGCYMLHELSLMRYRICTNCDLYTTTSSALVCNVLL